MLQVDKYMHVSDVFLGEHTTLQYVLRKQHASYPDGTSFDSGVVGEGGAGWRWEPPGDDARFSIAPGDYALPALEDFSSDAGSTGTHADVVRCCMFKQGRGWP